MKRRAPFGAWASPITADFIASSGIFGIEQLEADGDRLLWAEPRPAEGGRTALVEWRPVEGPRDLLPDVFDVRTTVHEYGGRSFAAAGGSIVFSNLPDCRLYRLKSDGEAWPLTPAGRRRFADPVIDTRRGRVLAVQEDHSGEGEPINSLVSVGLDGGTPETMASGYDFYASPRLSPDGNRLAWICWRHPNMPWDDTELWLADLASDGDLTSMRRVAGGPGESVLFPRWSPQGVLHFITDRGGFWHLRRLVDCGIEDVALPDAELGGIPRVLIGGAWDFAPDGSAIHYAYSRDGIQRLARIIEQGFQPLETPFTFFLHVQGFGDRAAVVGSGPQRSTCIALVGSGGEVEVIRESEGGGIPDGYFSTPEEISFPTTDGATAHGFLYLPANPEFEGPEGEQPPMIVNAHGGPVAATFAVRSLDLQFWTSRGVAVLDVNYRGSIGYGRRYREALYGRWGQVDVDDCVAGARHVISRGLVDPKRVAIRGASAGGYTTMAALAFRDLFAAGLSFCGISDLETSMDISGTHKFESRYHIHLLGPYPERADLYRERSPINRADQIKAPLLLLQGLEDPVVLPQQSRVIAESLRRRGVPVHLAEFEGEGHGFRRSDSLKRFYETELFFLGRAFGFEPADDLPVIPIDNLTTEVPA